MDTAGLDLVDRARPGDDEAFGGHADDEAGANPARSGPGAAGPRAGVLTIMLESVEKGSCRGRKLRTTFLKRSIVISAAALLASVLVPSVWGQSSPGLITNYPFRDVFARHYQVGRSPRIEIGGGISGPVTISAGQTGMVDIDVQRTAATQGELDCHQVKIDHRPDLITITQVQFTDRRECRTIRASQSLTLQVPSDALLQLSSIAGELQVSGPVKAVTADSIAGHVSITGAGTVDLVSLARGLSLSLGGASPGSARIESVVGVVELDVAERHDVEIRISALQGEITSVPPDFVRHEMNDGYLLRSGAGGTLLSISSINGDLVVRRK